MPFGDQSASWTGTEVARLNYGCTPTSPTNNYPALYWACNNGTGLHIVSTGAGWANNNEALEIYLR
jgi:hypothetical protein